MAGSANSNPVVWETKLHLSKAVMGLQREEQQLLQRAHQTQMGNQQVMQQQQQQQQQHNHQQQPQHHQHHQQQKQAQQAQQIIQIPTLTVCPSFVLQDGRGIQHLTAGGMTQPAAAATMALPQGVVPPYQITGNLPAGQMYKQVMMTTQGQQIILQQPTMITSVGGQQVLVHTTAPTTSPALAPQAVSSGPAVTGPQVTTQLGQPISISQQVIAPVHGPQQALAQAPVGKSATLSQVISVSTASASGSVSGQPAQVLVQVDGVGDTSSDEEEDDDENEEKDEDLGEEDDAGEEDPLNSEDDVSDVDPSDLFDAENVVVCQYDKIHRSKNRWKFHLKDGIMNLNGKDYVFSKSVGDAEW
uniref:transcription initiation factor IIA subunit 1-like isoform X2 n=1 Tax=Myxine glutinosa TaxID=7769 RepID=UPI00358DDEFA